MLVLYPIYMSYPDVARAEILNLIPSNCVYHTCLDIGCGTGSTSSYLSKRGVIHKSFGVDNDHSVASKACQRLTQFKCAEVEEFIGSIAEIAPDLILMFTF